MTFVYNRNMLNGLLTVTHASTVNPTQSVTDLIPFQYCATLVGAKYLQAWLAQNGITTQIIYDWPLYPQQIGNLDPQSSKVPYLIDGKGAKERAGDLIYNFGEGMPYSIASYIAIRAWTLDDTQ
jgi:hypothetical protein